MPDEDVEMQIQEDLLLVTSELVHGRRMGTLEAFPSLPLFLTLARMPYLDLVSQGSRELGAEEGQDT